MRTFQYTIRNPRGLDAKIAAEIIRAAEGFQSEISVGKEETILNAKSLMGMIALQGRQGDTLTIQIEGKDEVEAERMLRGICDKVFR